MPFEFDAMKSKSMFCFEYLTVGTDTVKVEDAKLGSGSFGTVFRGMCRGKEVAIKVLRQQSLDDKAVAEFKRECKIMSSLKHPNLLLFMGACTQPGKLKIGNFHIIQLFDEIRQYQ
jgi:serine/threonine protein kinase